MASDGRPTVSTFTLRWWSMLPAYQRDADIALGFPLLRYLSLLGDQAEKVRVVLENAPARLGDPRTADVAALPWLAQIAGVDARLYPDTDGQRSALRAAIIGAPAARRSGSVGAILAAIRPLLSGTRTVALTDVDPVGFSYRVTSYAAETPDPGAVAALVARTAPAGLLAAYELLSGWTWADVEDTDLTWDALEAGGNGPTWEAWEATVPATGGMTWEEASVQTWADVEAAQVAWDDYRSPTG